MSKKPSGKSVKTASKATERARREALAVTETNLKAIAAADQENARARDERKDSGDGMTASERAMARSAEANAAGIDPTAQQVACIDVDPKAEIAAAKKHEQSGKAKRQPKQDQKAGAKRARAPKASKEPKPKKLSALDAAAQVLSKSDKPMTSQALIDEMAAKKLWTSPGGKTPSATLYAAVLREISAKGKESRFKKVDRGLFVSNA